MKFKVIIFLLFTSVMFGQYTSEHTGAHIDSTITEADNFLDGFITPGDYGIEGDSTDESTEFNTMLADLSSGDVLYIPTGDYLIPSVNDTITVPVTLIGDGLKNTRLFEGKFVFTREPQLKGISFYNAIGNAVTFNPLDVDADSSEGTWENVTVQECGFFNNTFRGVDYDDNPEDTIKNFYFINNVGDGGGVGKALIYFDGSYKRAFFDKIIAKNFLNAGILIGGDGGETTNGQLIITNCIIDSIINATSGEAQGILAFGYDVTIAFCQVSNVWNDDDTDSEGIYVKADRALIFGCILHNAGYGDGAITSKGAVPLSDYYTNRNSVIGNTITYDRPSVNGQANAMYLDNITLIANNKIKIDTTGIGGIDIKSISGNTNVIGNNVQVRDGGCLNFASLNVSDTTAVINITGGIYQSENTGINFAVELDSINPYITMNGVIVIADSGYAIRHLGLQGKSFKINSGIIRSNSRTGSYGTIYINTGAETFSMNGVDIYIGALQTLNAIVLRANEINSVTNNNFIYKGNIVNLLHFNSGTPTLIDIQGNTFRTEDGATDGVTYYINVEGTSDKVIVRNNSFLADDDDVVTAAIWSQANITDFIVSDNYANTSVKYFFKNLAGKTITNVQLYDNHWEEKSDAGNFYDIEGTVTNSWIYRNIGFMTENNGSSSIADGGTIAHGLAGTPTWVSVAGSIAGEIVTVSGLDGTNITVDIKDNDGSAGTTQTIYWEAVYKP